MLHMFGPLQEPQTAAMSALCVHGAMHGGAGGLCQETGEMPRM